MKYFYAILTMSILTFHAVGQTNQGLDVRQNVNSGHLFPSDKVNNEALINNAIDKFIDRLFLGADELSKRTIDRASGEISKQLAPQIEDLTNRVQMLTYGMVVVLFGMIASILLCSISIHRMATKGK